MDKRNGEITNKIFEILNNIKGFDVAMANPNNGIIIAKYNNINYYISVDPIFNDNEEGDKANAEPFERIVKTHSHVFRWRQFYAEYAPDIYVGKIESEEWIMDNFDKETNATFIIGENKIDKTFTPEEIWNALCKVIRGASGEAVDGIIILCEEILDVPAPQIEKKLFSDGVIDDLYYRSYDEYDI